MDSYLAFIDEHDEWTDTRAVFDITGDVHGTTLHFTHEDLTAAESACFESCSRLDVLHHPEPAATDHHRHRPAHHPLRPLMTPDI
ncbi:hypothetical protein [Mycolicibacterium sp. P9-22]|uniref:hypothetical protein n=1 Tax=Mycolicibacterium sp. P9-22 TaxID=2024613 RepID=UPI001D14C361|nr:hypothetical protein [Mycolicibacterium sp. P9-22]